MPDHQGYGVAACPARARYLFVDVSEGNNAATFYARYGFKFSHDVLGGIIKAYYQEI